MYDGVKEADVWKSIVFSARALIEQEPDYTFATSRLLLHDIRREVLGEEVDQVQMVSRYPEYFKNYIQVGVKAGLLDEKLSEFDLDKIGGALKGDRDLKFQYLGLQTLYDRYLLHIDGARFELPQAFWMRVAMGLSIQEVDREDRAIEFYNLLSSFDFVSSTPTLFNSGTRRPQLSSCFLTTVGDDLNDIYDSIRENAMLSKFSGGLRNDRLDTSARTGLAHQRHQRQEPGCSAIPESRQRHRDRGQPGWQAQRRSLLLPGNLAHGH